MSSRVDVAVIGLERAVGVETLQFPFEADEFDLPVIVKDFDPHFEVEHMTLGMAKKRHILGSVWGTVNAFALEGHANYVASHALRFRKALAL